MKKAADFTRFQTNDLSAQQVNPSILALIKDVEPYVAHRLMIAETLTVIPQNMYNASDVIDEVMVDALDELNGVTNDYDLKLLFFKRVKTQLDNLFKSEAWHQSNVSTDKLLHAELNKLKERFTYNADDDFIMNEELNDISYHQKDFQKPLKLYSDHAHSVISGLALERWDKPQMKLFRKMYNFLSLEASNVVDLHVFGKLSSGEIAQIKGVSELLIRDITLQVKDNINQIMGLITDEEA